MDLLELRAIAREVVVQACELTADLQKRLLSAEIRAKSDLSPVTVADFASQALITLLLAARCPGLPLVGEEDARAPREDAALAAKVHESVQKFIPEVTLEQVLEALDKGSHPGGEGRFWVLDPIDGTKGFLRKDQFAVCLCMIDNGKVLVAALGCPSLPVDPPPAELGCVFLAARGQGATQLDLASGRERAIHVSEAVDPSSCSYVESMESGHSSHGAHARIAGRLHMLPPIRMDSQCKFGVVARGQASLYLRCSDRDQQIWDIAAGAMIVEEAGGKVTDLQGRPLCFSRGRTVGSAAVFASNGRIHQAVVEAATEAATE
ncbi:unnamed protein product [Effrenium voratum]|uniref:3'(2'),5'-bisphosphate nucleotidase n=1 Tax=Effrenium voratum TaxID=2562239 RepID=A0AA36IMQ3_9DINO|nr:unnamed protein product [Effrenium voratum]CAJ1416739.1 unnamed protein product [Effrenium voratum]